MTQTFRQFLAAAAAFAALAAQPHAASAGVLIGISDDNPITASALGLSDTGINGAVGWTQTVAATGVTVRAGLVDVFPGGAANWWITTALGPGASAADVVASGTYLGSPTGNADFDLAPYTVLASGLDLGPGAYWLVVDGEPGDQPISHNWLAESLGETTVTLAPGFTLGDALITYAATPFGPAAAFVPVDSRFAFKLDGKVSAAPEPAAWALMMLGFAGLGAALRRRPYASAASSGTPGR